MEEDLIVQEEPGIIKATDYRRVITVDYEGRIIFFANRGKTYRRSLFNRYLEVGYRGGLRVARPLSAEEGRRVAEEAYAFLQEASLRMNEESRGFISDALSRGPGFLEEDAKKFIKVYGGEVPIVPPDQYFPVYVQASVGCYWNRCTFCNLYRGKSYGVKGVGDLKDHIRMIKEAFGRGISSRRSVFLGDANALAAPQGLIREWLGMVKDELGLPVYSFVDAITTQLTKGIDELKELRALGLNRIYLGLESGSADVLRLLGKPETPQGAVELLNNAKAAGLSVGIIILIGAGGKAYYKEHVFRTAELISRIPLGRSDIIFLSPIYIYSWLPYYVESKELGLLSFNEKMKQIEEISSRIKEAYRMVHGEDLSAPIVPYDLAEAIY